MNQHDAPGPQLDVVTAGLLRRDAVRRAAEALNTLSGPGLEAVWPMRDDAVGAVGLDAGRAVPVRPQAG